VVVIGSSLNTMRGTASADEFHRRLLSSGAIVLPAGFSSQDPGDAADALLREVGTRLGSH